MISDLKIYGVIDYLKSFGITHNSDVSVFHIVYQDPSDHFYQEKTSFFNLEKFITKIDQNLILNDGLKTMDKKTGISYIKEQAKTLHDQKEAFGMTTTLERSDDIYIRGDDVYLSSSLSQGRINPLEEFTNTNIEKEEFTPNTKGLQIDGCLYIGSREFLIPHLDQYFAKNISIPNLEKMNLFHLIGANDRVIEADKQNKSRKKMPKDELMLLFDAHMFNEIEKACTTKK